MPEIVPILPDNPKYFLMEGGFALSRDGKEIRISIRVSNREFRRLEDLHQHYDSELESLNKYHYLTQDQEMKRIELKKLKLWTKDRMARMIREYCN